MGENTPKTIGCSRMWPFYLIRQALISPLAYDIAHQFAEYPERWTQGYQCVRHESGMEIWTIYGKSMFAIHSPTKHAFSWADKAFVWDAYRKWFERRTMYQLMKATDPAERHFQ